MHKLCLNQWSLHKLCLNWWWLHDDLLLWLVYNLTLYGLVLNALYDAFLWNVLDIAVLENLWDILCLVFDGVVINNLLLAWNVVNALHWLILDVRLLVWDVSVNVFVLKVLG